jgi:hypothetical protein
MGVAKVGGLRMCIDTTASQTQLDHLLVMGKTSASMDPHRLDAAAWCGASTLMILTAAISSTETLWVQRFMGQCSRTCAVLRVLTGLCCSVFESRCNSIPRASRGTRFACEGQLALNMLLTKCSNIMFSVALSRHNTKGVGTTPSPTT